MSCYIVLTRGDYKYPVEETGISYVQSDDKYCDVYLCSDPKLKFTEHRPLRYFQCKLHATGLFIKLGRSLLVNRTQIHKYSRHLLKLKNGAEIMINQAIYTHLNRIFS